MGTHEFPNNTVEDDTIIIPVLDMCNEILHRLGRDIGIQFEKDVALVSVYSSGRGGSARLLDHLDSGTLFFASRAFVEDISVAPFRVAMLSVLHTP